MRTLQDHGLQDEKLLKTFSYINGSWHSSEGEFDVTNPANGELVRIDT